MIKYPGDQRMRFRDLQVSPWSLFLGPLSNRDARPHGAGAIVQRRGPGSIEMTSWMDRVRMLGSGQRKKRNEERATPPNPLCGTGRGPGRARLRERTQVGRTRRTGEWFQVHALPLSSGHIALTRSHSREPQDNRRIPEYRPVRNLQDVHYGSPL